MQILNTISQNKKNLKLMKTDERKETKKIHLGIFKIFLRTPNKYLSLDYWFYYLKKIKNKYMIIILIFFLLETVIVFYQ